MSDQMRATWSFSRLKSFETCPRQYYHVQVLKEFPQEDTSATLYGTAFHKACEDYIRDGTPLDEGFMFFEPTLKALKALPGDKHCEMKLGLTEGLQPCEFFAENVWFRGIVDLLIIDGPRATVIDYKTGKSSKYADPGQLELMALAVFKHFPQVQHVRGGLIFAIADAFIKRSYDAENQGAMWLPWLRRHRALQEAHRLDVWNPRPSGLCNGWCPVLSCPHNGGS